MDTVFDAHEMIASNKCVCIHTHIFYSIVFKKHIFSHFNFLKSKYTAQAKIIIAGGLSFLLVRKVLVHIIVNSVSN